MRNFPRMNAIEMPISQAGRALNFSRVLSETSQPESVTAHISRLIIGGWAGRSEEANRHHIKELAAIGVAPPRKTPMFYRVGAELLTTAPSIQVAGDGSSGEAEVLLLRHRGEYLVGIGSDHTDRVVEAYGVTISKQVCPKPIGNNFWRFDDVKGHWDKLILRSWTGQPGAMDLYQQGTVAALLDPRDLVTKFEAEGETFADGTAMYCGTLPVIGAVRHASQFSIELEDPVLGRKLAHSYTTVKLAIVD